MGKCVQGDVIQFWLAILYKDQRFSMYRLNTDHVQHIGNSAHSVAIQDRLDNKQVRRVWP